MSSLARPFGLVESGECEHPSPCDEPAAGCVPDAGSIAGKALCAFHLALWADTRGDQETLAQLDLEDEVATDRWLSLQDAPPEIKRQVRYERLGVDHHGLAHYYIPGRGDDDHERVITIDRGLELVDGYHVPPHVGLEGWIEHVDERRCWIELDEAFRSEGGESA
jgi:hypothetical protein